MGWGVFEHSHEQQQQQHQVFGGSGGGGGASHQSRGSSGGLKEETWPACQMSLPAASRGSVVSSSGSGRGEAAVLGSPLNLPSPPATTTVSSTSQAVGGGEKKMSACRFSGQAGSGQGLGLSSPMAANSYSLDSVQQQQHQQSPFMGHSKPQQLLPTQLQQQQQQQQQYYMNDVNAGQQHYAGLPSPYAFGGQVAQTTAAGVTGTAGAMAGGGAVTGHPVANSGYDLMPGGHSVAAAAAAAAARSCALPSPTIYPPTPPPSAPWVHPWFMGDTF